MQSERARSRRIIVLGLVLVLLDLNTGWSESVLNLTNPSFESPFLREAGSESRDVDGWQVLPQNQVSTVRFHREMPTGRPTDGDQLVMAEVGQFHLTQTIGDIAPDTRYVFTIDLFSLEDHPESSRAEIALECTGDPSVVLARAQSQPVLHTGEHHFTFLPRKWTPVTVAFHSADFRDMAGKALQIRVSGSHLALDNARGLVIGPGEARSWYISSSRGSDWSDGISPSMPWNSFVHINAIPLVPGDKINLRRGDRWGEELHLRGKGTAWDPIELGPYGDPAAPRPVIQRSDPAIDKCVIIEGPSFWEIRGLDCRTAKIGMYLRYLQDYENRDVSISDCYFEGNTDPTFDPADHNYEIAWSDGIFLGGKVGGPRGHPNNERTVLDGLRITRCEFRECAHGFGVGFYYPFPYKGRLRNLLMADCCAWDCVNGAFALTDVDEGTVERVRSIGGGGDSWAGSTLGFCQGCRNITIDDCEFAHIDRHESSDGVGFDFEGDNQDCVFSNNVVHHCDGAGLISLSTNGPNQDILIRDCTFFSNCQDPWNNQMAVELCCGSPINTGKVENCGLYRKDGSIDFLSADCASHTFSDIREGDFKTVARRRVWWDFGTQGDPEGWSGFDQWDSISAAGGALSGVSTGPNPICHSPLTWINTHSHRYAWIRMKSTLGTRGRLGYVTETDPFWDDDKSVEFAIQADGQMHDYFVDLEASNSKGVITQISFQPTNETGALTAIDHIRFVENPGETEAPPRLPPPPPTSVTFFSTGGEDGWILEEDETSKTGSVYESQSLTIRVGDSATKASYRGLVSFSTAALPDDATLVSATLKLTRLSVVGKDPWSYGKHLMYADHCLVDIAAPYFGATGALAASDWEASASAEAVGHFVIAFADGLQVWDQLNEEGLSRINRTGTTQFRIRFQGETNGDNADDYVELGSGNHPDVSVRPQLTISYHANPHAEVGKDESKAALHEGATER